MSEKGSKNSMSTENVNSNSSKPTCGIIMPISAIDNCSAEHWADVLSILREVIESADFESKLVSDADDGGIIQKRIVQNVYSNEIVVCDVSGKNPNVMFELGMRLAFDKPTVIVKDDFTNYSFDTSVIEHVEYPRDLRFTKIISFKEKLRNKIIATHKMSKDDPNYSTFLRSFGEYKIAQLQSKEISSEAYILESLEEMRKEIRLLRVIPPSRRLVTKSRSPSPLMGFIQKYAVDNRISTIDDLRADRLAMYAFLSEQTPMGFVYDTGHELRSAIDRILEDEHLLTEIIPVNNDNTPKIEF